MSALRRPAPRFVIWTALLIAVAAASGVAGLSAWIIAALEFTAWLVVALCEHSIAGPWAVPAERAQPAAFVLPQPVAVEPEPVPALDPEPEPVALAPAVPVEETPQAPPVAAEPLAVAPGPTRWSVPMLERLTQEQAPENEELGFLVVYLRDFAGPDGLLPAGFDSLVRESFGSLLPRGE